jgi:NAD kinase
VSEGSTIPRILVVSRPTEHEALVERHGTYEQARFFLESHGQSMAEVERRRQRQDHAIATVSHAIPSSFRRGFLRRADLSRFVFEPEDIIVAVGQDGLVANVAKYLSGHKVIGINPDPTAYQGILVPHAVDRAAKLVLATARGRVEVEARTMVEAETDDGQRLVALNEVFLGHRSHQSARYELRFGGRGERQSSSGIIVATGTGATGWARSIALERREVAKLPSPVDQRLAFFVREAYPSVSTGTSITTGSFDVTDRLEVRSEMNEGGVLFGDGIEDDRIEFAFGITARIEVSKERLMLVHGVT